MQSLETTIRDVLHRGAVAVMSEIGTELIAYCPFHDNRNTPSFSINRHSGLWQCFNPDCAQRGGIRLLRKLLLNEEGRLPTADISADYLDRLLHDTSVEQNLEDMDKLMQNCIIDYSSDDVEYLQPLLDRGFDLDTLRYFEVGYSKIKSRIILPARDQSYNLVGLIGRAVMNHQLPKYLYTTGFPKSMILFNLHNAKSYDEVIVVEGSLDALKVHQAGFPNVIAVLGAIVTKFQMQLLHKNFDSIVIIPDNDDAGFAMADAIMASTRGKQISLAECPSDCKDAGELDTKQIVNIIKNKKDRLFQ